MATPAGAPWYAILDDWPNCGTSDCQYKLCKWAGTGLCHPCSVKQLGYDEMQRRYVVTHDVNGEWTGKVAS